MIPGICITLGILLLVPAIFFFMPGPMLALTGVVSSDGSDELMRKTYRSLAKWLLFLSVLLILTGTVLIGRGVYSPAPNPATDGLSDYSSDAYGISFSYPSDYVLTERDIATTQAGTKTYHQITLINKNDLPVPANAEGPTAITIGFNAPDIQAQPSGRPSATTTVSGFPATSSNWSGLYEGTTIIVTRPNMMYSLSVTFMEMGSHIVQDFVTVRDSVKIVEPKQK